NVTLKNARNPIWIFSNNSSETRYIENCTIDNCLNGIIFDGYYSTSENLNETLTITNNVIKDIGNSTNRNPGIYVDGTFEELNVENNEILNCYGGIKASFQYASKNQVIGPQILINQNTIHDLVSSGNPAIGIEVIDTTPQYFTPSNTVPYGEIQNNTFDNIDGYEIYTDLTYPLYWQVQNDPIPGAPYLQTISKDANDHPVLTWTPPGDNDIQKYIVFKQYTNSSGTESWTVDVGLATTWTDNGITITKFGNTTAIYKVKAVDNVGQESAYSNSRAVDGDGPLWKPVSEIPKEFALHQAYPNPFNPSTQISFDIPSETKVLIELYDLLGQKVRTLVQTNCQPGYHSVVWDGKNDNGNPMSTGTYFIKMVTGEYQKLTKCTLIK
ncbi:MAG: T9SS type A sorting domain-containing protein, partial [Candidatus Marinimicrobia bacterium]|nr:T9SS type A sorting domain-containing protein [Candidatus Neomarinimicrobiota bacterium]